MPRLKEWHSAAVSSPHHQSSHKRKPGHAEGTNDVTVIGHALLLFRLVCSFFHHYHRVASYFFSNILKPEYHASSPVQPTIERFTSRNPPFLNHFKTKSSIMSNRALQIGGLAVAGGVGYYLYNAGGDPKVAEKKMEGQDALFTTIVTSTNMMQPMRTSSRPQ